MISQSRKDVLEVLLETREKLGDVARLPLWRGQSMLIAHPDSVRHVLHDNRHNYTRGRASRWLRALWGEGLVLSDGEEWARQRRLMRPVFHSQRLEALASAMVREIQELIGRWDRRAIPDGPVDLTAEMWDLTLRILVEALFGGQKTADASAVCSSVTRLLGFSNERMSGVIPPPYSLFTPRNLARRIGARSSLNRLLRETVRDRCRVREDFGDLLSALVLARDEETGLYMGEEWICNQVMSLFLAGRESTATALVWVFYLLSKHPHVDFQLNNELSRVLGDRLPTVADLRELKYTRALIDETLRLYPPAYKFTRQAVASDEIEGSEIPAGSLVVLSPWVTHRHPRIWNEPNSFHPGRFLGSDAADIPQFGYFPFGGGPRLCAGRSFALLEAQLVIAMLAQRYRLELSPQREILPQGGLTLRPSEAVVVAVRRRGKADD